MRAEDLFEAIGGIDENLIARSEKRIKSAQHTSKKSAQHASDRSERHAPERAAAARRRRAARKRKKAASIYKYAVIVLASAAAVFILLMARDLMGPGRTNGLVRQGKTVADSQVNPEDSQLAEAQDFEDGAGISEEASQDAADQTAGGLEAQAAPEEAAEAEEGSRAANQTPSMSDQVENQADAADETGGKSPVDLLGNMKGDYVTIEYISAEDEANGGSRKVPEYSEEGEKALTAALDRGKARPSVMADKGDPVYYVYLTNSSGKEDKITFYENGYVSMDSIPGMVMKVPDDEYAEVMKLFE